VVHIWSHWPIPSSCLIDIFFGIRPDEFSLIFTII
jgi:hypothetical protein